MSSRTTTLAVFALIVVAGIVYVAWPTQTVAPTVNPSASATTTPNPAIILNPSATATPSASLSSPTAYSTLTTYADPAKRFRVGIPQDWSAREFKDQDQKSIGVILTKPTGETIQVMIKAAVLTPSLDDWLENRDQESATAYEGKPSKKILTTRQTVVSGYPALERKEEWLAAGFTTVVTYVKAEGSIYVIELIPQAELAAAELRSIYEAVVGSLVIGESK